MSPSEPAVPSPSAPRIGIVGAGPAGLFAAELLAARGAAVTVFEAKPSPARKLLMAGRGGLNLTHSEPLERFCTRYGPQSAWFAAVLAEFPPDALRAWCKGLGIDTFIGTSGRVFPDSFKASVLVRAWLRRLASLGVTLRTRHRWTGFGHGGATVLAVEGPAGARDEVFDAVLLALGGASWPRLGSDGAWAPLLADRGVAMAPFRPSNCGFRVAWSAFLRDRHAGAPLKNVALTCGSRTVKGEMVVTAAGIEGGIVYALSAPLRDALEADGAAVAHLDLKPDLAEAAVAERLAARRGGRSLAAHLKAALKFTPVMVALVHEVTDDATRADPARLAVALKALPLRLTATAGLERAISSAGGVRFDAVDPATLELAALPGVFVAGEMLDWEAPTGGYLLQGTFATALRAADGVARKLGLTAVSPPP
ncbi:NAD(FAD)-utilizing dehydrogenase [Caenispirillum salinarum AK4]|uniref:NAD(FAD)-utilizing dehydrogenase n=1 Tax=Caenispirillum salinarum AK4 TaxID=1238182 RepID=K9GRX0_9PROT|nr:TIGR03862 family flavoprotein [Caenispirillum salinarum]EKV28700.1 NAD(FAD)-utilizing dehydrogenase [Caenispirillum salinarum AK4]